MGAVFCRFPSCSLYLPESSISTPPPSKVAITLTLTHTPTFRFLKTNTNQSGGYEVDSVFKGYVSRDRRKGYVAEADRAADQLLRRAAARELLLIC